jgi:hypothetical protein
MPSGSQLGIVLTPYGQIKNAYPWEITSSGPDNAPQLPPFDPYYNQRGEQGFYYDTALGAPFRAPFGVAGPSVRRVLGGIPTDAELAPHRGYTPVRSGWIRTANGYMPPPWTPGVGPGPGLGDTMVPPTTPGTVPGTAPTLDPSLAPWQAQVLIAEENHRRRMFLLTALSTSAVVAVSLYNLVRAVRAERRGAAATV